MDKVAMVYGQMNEPPGARLRVGLSGLTMAEYFRDEGQDVAALHRQHLPLRPGGLRGVGAARPHAERRRLPADARDRDGAAAGADHLDAHRLGHVGAGDLRARRRPHRPGAGEHVRAPRLDDRARPQHRREGHLSGGRPAALDLARAAAGHRLRRALPTARRACRRCCSATPTCRTSSRSSASTSSPTRTSSSSQRARKIERFLSQPFFTAAQFTGTPGEFVKLEDTIRGFTEILDGKHDELPEQAFYMVGPIEQAVERGEAARRRGAGGSRRARGGRRQAEAEAETAGAPA